MLQFSNYFDSSSESSSAEDEASFSSYRLQPPSGFSDSRELSEAECDRDNTLHLDKLLARYYLGSVCNCPSTVL